MERLVVGVKVECVCEQCVCFEMVGEVVDVKARYSEPGYEGVNDKLVTVKWDNGEESWMYPSELKVLVEEETKVEPPKAILESLCGGNFRGYKGTKEQIEEMFELCLKDAKEGYASESSINGLKYDYERRDQLKPNDKGEYVIKYWSKW